MCRKNFFKDQCSHASTALSHHNAFNTDWMMSFLFHYSDPHSVLSARSQSCLCHQYWKAGGRRGTERGKVTFSFFFGPFFSLSACFSQPSWFNASRYRDAMISCCGQSFCHRVHHALRSNSCGYSTYRLQLISPDVLFSDTTCHFNTCFSAVFAPTSFSPLTVTESYRGLNSQRGETSSPSGQLQRCQQESQEAPATLVHPFLTHSGQRPVGGGEQDGRGAGQEGVQGGFSREGIIFPRSSRV